MIVNQFPHGTQVASGRGADHWLSRVTIFVPPVGDVLAEVILSDVFATFQEAIVVEGIKVLPLLPSHFADGARQCDSHDGVALVTPRFLPLTQAVWVDEIYCELDAAIALPVFVIGYDFII